MVVPLMAARTSVIPARAVTRTVSGAVARPLIAPPIEATAGVIGSAARNRSARGVRRRPDERVRAHGLPLPDHAGRALVLAERRRIRRELQPGAVRQRSLGQIDARGPRRRSPSARHRLTTRGRQHVVEERPGRREAGDPLLAVGLVAGAGRARAARSTYSSLPFAVRSRWSRWALPRDCHSRRESVVDGPRRPRSVPRAGSRRSVGRRRRHRPRPVPRSPAKSGSHSAIVVPIRAPTCAGRRDHRLAERDAVGDVRGKDDHVRLCRRRAQPSPAASRACTRLYVSSATIGMPAAKAVERAARRDGRGVVVVARQRSRRAARRGACPGAARAASPRKSPSSRRGSCRLRRRGRRAAGRGR